MEYDAEKDVFDRGRVQVYTGDGKGKTTAAMGLAVRALGAGMRVYFAQFLKHGDYSEKNILQKLDNLVYRQYGLPGFITRKPSEEDMAEAERGVKDAREALESGLYDLVILDEANVACSLGLITPDDIMSLLRLRGDATELVLTGRNAMPELIEAADLVTEMREVKHYFTAGVRARKGIES
jgi:cob(I)alamin adenosyltransferase